MQRHDLERFEIAFNQKLLTFGGIDSALSGFRLTGL
jgi:hypothetical protein